MIPVIALTLLLAAPAQSPSTMAAVAIYSVNAERKWPSDDREPAITAEALRLLEVTAKAIADDRHLEEKKFSESLAEFSTAREAFAKLAADADDRPAAAHEALKKGRVMLDALLNALHREDPATRQHLAEVKRSSDSFDKHKAVREQADLLEAYFRASSALLRSTIETT